MPVFWRPPPQFSGTPPSEKLAGFGLADESVCGYLLVMFREKVIIETWPFTKKELVEFRRSDKFKEGDDWKLDKTHNGNPVIVWMEGGLKKLLAVKNLKIEEPAAPEEVKAESPEPVVEKKSNDMAPAIVRQKLPNKRMVACEIRGQWENVWVKDSSALRPGHIINAVYRGGRWVGIFRVNNAGRVYAG